MYPIFKISLQAVKTSLLVMVFSALLINISEGKTLKELLVPLLKSHNLVVASENDLTASEERLKVSKGAWFPTATITSHYGKEKQNKTSGTDDTDLISRQADLTVNQLLWDFGATNSAVNAADFAVKSSGYLLESTKQDLILRGATSYLNVIRTWRGLGYARQSEINIKKQTELENALVKKGAGISSDALQAKATLSGAQARRVGAEGALSVARNAYRSVFRNDPSNFKNLKVPKLVEGMIPKTVEDAVKIALKGNPKLRASDMGAAIAMETINSTKSSSFYPKFDVIASTLYKHNAGGAIGHQEDKSLKVQMTFPFNLGFTAINTLKASKNDATSASLKVAETRDLIEQSVRDAWANLKTAKSTRWFLRNQATISSEFLELARKERKLGNRSLLDVLNGETALTNAQSDASAVEVDVLIARFTLINAIGRLKLNALK